MDRQQVRLLEDDIYAEAKKQVPIPMDVRQRLAEKHGVPLHSVTYLIGALGIKGNHTWTEAELRDIWTTYEALGAQALAEKYGVSTRSVIQQYHNMSKAEARTPNPWQKK